MVLTYLSKKTLLPLLPLAIIVAALFIGSYLVQEKQEIRKEAATYTLDDVGALINAPVYYTGDKNNLAINKVSDGVFTIRSSSFNCTPGTTDCLDPDRYEIRFPKIINNIYGLGNNSFNGKVKIDDFLDEAFGTGHFKPKNQSGYIYDGDFARGRTPVFVIPEENVIIVYVQDMVKMLRLTRNGTTGCPSGNTCLVLKKSQYYNEGSPGTLMVIKGSSPSDMYSKYYNTLKNTFGFYFKKPNRRIFGVNWESWIEYGCNTSSSGIQSAVDRYKQIGIILSSATIGSGYWGAVNGCLATGCESQSSCPTTDALTVDSAFGGSTSGLNSLFSSLINFGTYPIIGMRHNIALNNVDRIKSIIGQSNPLLNNSTYYGTFPSDNVKLLNVTSESVITSWADALKIYYGNFLGLKEDEMMVNDQFGYKGTTATSNLPDGYISRVYKFYNNFSDFIIWGANDWFGVGSDGQYRHNVVQRYLSGFSGYSKQKDLIDSGLISAASGYPHPVVGLADPNSDLQQFLRFNMLSTFLPITMHSKGFWNYNVDSSFQYFSKLRLRLSQYAYDNAVAWYETGVPTLMRPLFVDYPSDSQVHSMYNTNSSSQALDEYMFGNALLVRPVLTSSSSHPVYFPSGKWLSFLKAESPIVGPTTRTFTLSGITDYPVFLKEGEILIIGSEANFADLNAFVYLDTKSQTSTYKLNHSNGKTFTLQAFKSGSNVYIKNTSTNNQVLMTDDTYGKGYKIANIMSLLSDVVPTSTPTPTVTPTPGPCDVQITSPADNSIINIGTTISWTTCKNSAAYQIRIRDEASGANVFGPFSLSQSSIQVSSLMGTSMQAGKKYWFDVRGCINTACSQAGNWSTTITYWWKSKPTVTPTSGCTPGTKPGDANGDCKVDGFDYVVWWQNFKRQVSGGPSQGDFDKSGYVDGFDYVIWWQNFGR